MRQCLKRYIWKRYRGYIQCDIVTLNTSWKGLWCSPRSLALSCIPIPYAPWQVSSKGRLRSSADRQDEWVFLSARHCCWSCPCHIEKEPFFLSACSWSSPFQPCNAPMMNRNCQFHCWKQVFLQCFLCHIHERTDFSELAYPFQNPTRRISLCLNVCHSPQADNTPSYTHSPCSIPVLLQPFHQGLLVCKHPTKDIFTTFTSWA